MPKLNGIERKDNSSGIEHKSYSTYGLKVEGDTGIIEAFVSVFNNKDHGNEIVRPGFFTKSIQRKLPKGVWAHDWKQPIAKTLEAREVLAGDPMLPPELKELGGTYIKGQFNLDTQRGRESYSDIKFGIVDEFSIGYKVLRDGTDKETGARELIEGDWKEWSPVLVGMNDQTQLVSIKGNEPHLEPTVMTKEELEALRKAVGAIDLPLAPLDHVWDSSATEKAVREFCKATDAPNAEYAKSFLYVSGDGGDRFGDYALPFSRPVGEKMVAVPKRIIAVAERLDAMEISDEAKTAIRTKIDGYFAAMRTQFKDERIVTPWAAKAAATECTCCANDTTDCGCATKDKTGAGVCSCHADCAKCMTAKCAGLAATAAGGKGVETIESLTEKVAQLTAKIDAESEDKAGARNSAADKKKLATIHDAAASMEPSVCSGSMKGIVVSDQVKGMYDDVLAEMTKPSLWDVYYAYLEVLDLIEDLPGVVGDSPIDKVGMIDEALAALIPRMREASLAKLEEPDVEYIYWAAPPADFKELSSEVLGTKTFDAHQLAVGTAVREVAQTAGVVREAIDVLTKRANEKQEFRTGEGRAISPRFRARKADMDRELAQAQEQITAASEKSQSLTLVEPEDLSAQAAEQKLRFEKLRQNAAAN